MSTNGSASTENGGSHLKQIQDLLKVTVNDLWKLEVMTENFEPDAQQNYWAQMYLSI